jgi:hypothetical protein
MWSAASTRVPTAATAMSTTTPYSYAGHRVPRRGPQLVPGLQLALFLCQPTPESVRFYVVACDDAVRVGGPDMVHVEAVLGIRHLGRRHHAICLPLGPARVPPQPRLTAPAAVRHRLRSRTRA